MRNVSSAVAALALVVGSPASAAVERFNCGDPGKDVTVLTIDTETGRFDAAEGAAANMPICEQFSGMVVRNMDATKDAAAIADFRSAAKNCRIAIGDGIVLADYSTHTANVDTTTLLVLDRDAMQFRMIGRLRNKALKLSVPCKRAS